MSELTEKIGDRAQEVVSSVQDFVDSQDLSPVADVAEDLSRRARELGHEISDRAEQVSRRLGRQPSRWEVWFDSAPRFMLLMAGAGLTGAAAGWLTRERATTPESSSQPAPSRGSESMSPQNSDPQESASEPVVSQHAPDERTPADDTPEHLTGEAAADEPQLADDTGPLGQRAHDAQSAYPSNDQPDIEADEDMAAEGSRIAEERDNAASDSS